MHSELSGQRRPTATSELTYGEAMILEEDAARETTQYQRRLGTLVWHIQIEAVKRLTYDKWALRTDNRQVRELAGNAAVTSLHVGKAALEENFRRKSPRLHS